MSSVRATELILFGGYIDLLSRITAPKAFF